MSVPQLSIKSPISEITEALGEAGCVVVTGVTDANLRQSIKDELAPHMDKSRVIEIEKEHSTQFYPGRTRRVAALVARSSTLTDTLVARPLSKQCCEALLLPNGEFGYQLHVTAALEVGPGARSQVLHREGVSHDFRWHPRCVFLNKCQ